MKAGRRAPLWGILAVAVGAPVLSTLLFLFWTPAAHTNNGEVLPPARAPAALPAANGGAPFVFANAGGQWTLLAAAPAACDAACRRRLCRMRQLRLLLPGHYLRLRRVWLLTDGGAPPARLPQPADCGEAKNPALQSRAGVADVLDGVFVVRGGAELLPPARAGNAAAAVYLNRSKRRVGNALCPPFVAGANSRRHGAPAQNFARDKKIEGRQRRIMGA